jgi:hypothetical protein
MVHSLFSGLSDTCLSPDEKIEKTPERAELKASKGYKPGWDFLPDEQRQKIEL